MNEVKLRLNTLTFCHVEPASKGPDSLDHARSVPADRMYLEEQERRYEEFTRQQPLPPELVEKPG